MSEQVFHGIDALISAVAIKAMAFPQSTRKSNKRVIYFIEASDDRLEFVYQTLKNHDGNIIEVR